MPDQTHHHQATASVEARTDAIEAAFQERGMEPANFIREFKHLAEEEWVPENGARVVAKAWTDPAFRERLFANGREAVTELGLSMPPHHRHLVVLENTPKVHNVICCTLCSCTAFSIIGFAAGLVQGPGVSRPRRAPVAHRPEGDGPRAAGRHGDPRLGYDGRHPLHGAAGPPGRHRGLVRGEARRRSSPRTP